MDAVHEFTHAGLTVEIHYDESAESPRDRGEDCLTTRLVLDHRRYTLANEADDISPLDYFGGWDEVEAAIREAYDVVALQPVYGYDHGSLTCSTTPFSCPWDSGTLGLVFVTRQSMDDGFGAGEWTDEDVQRSIKAEVEEYAAYLRGEVYGYVVKDKDDETLDSCWGYIGSDYVEQAAREAAEGERDYLVSEAFLEAQRLLEALDSPDLLAALAAAKATVSQ